MALVLAPAQGELEALLILRARRAGDRWSGHVALPGGRRHPGEDLLATALRETLEETSVRLTRDDLVGELDDLLPRSVGAPRVVVRPFVFALPEKPRTVPHEAEVAAVRWAALDELCFGAQLPYFFCGSWLVWGMTRRIIAGLSTRLSRTRPSAA